MHLPQAYRSLPRPSSVLEPSHSLNGMRNQVCLAYAQLMNMIINKFFTRINYNNELHLIMDSPGIEPGPGRCKRPVLPLDYEPTITYEHLST